MKLGIMQPYFFPYIGYFQLINAVDKWIVFDIVQYKRHHWINRNRILHPKAGAQNIIVPLRKHSREALIREIEMADEQGWRLRIIAQLEHYKKKAPFYKETIDFLEECFAMRTESLSEFNTATLKMVCERLDIAFDYAVCSELNFELNDISAPGDWALRISKQLEAEEYINPETGREIFDSAKFEKSGVKLKFLAPKLSAYMQKGCEFVPGLSIIDVMMWNSSEDIKAMLSDFTIAP